VIGDSGRLPEHSGAARSPTVRPVPATAARCYKSDPQPARHWARGDNAARLTGPVRLELVRTTVVPLQGFDLEKP
jgi:hypothetical protein